MTTTAQVANLIAEIDAGVARIYRTQPFNRRTVLTAFIRGCEGTRFEDISFRIFALGMAAHAAEMAA